ncbi:hypothetical protein JXJ21_02610 [candidate division KSB1 bacterium]|nr:hypothetical protein [candidate division KSB1 bacterium]
MIRRDKRIDNTLNLPLMKIELKNLWHWLADCKLLVYGSHSLIIDG